MAFVLCLGAVELHTVDDGTWLRGRLAVNCRACNINSFTSTSFRLHWFTGCVTWRRRLYECPATFLFFLSTAVPHSEHIGHCRTLIGSHICQRNATVGALLRRPTKSAQNRLYHLLTSALEIAAADEAFTRIWILFFNSVIQFHTAQLTLPLFVPFCHWNRCFGQLETVVKVRGGGAGWTQPGPSPCLGLSPLLQF